MTYNARMTEPSEKEFRISRITTNSNSLVDDRVAVEEPMEIRVVFGASASRTMRSLSVTMRTPGYDRELAAGFLFTESILTSPDQIESIETSGSAADGTPTGNIVRITLKPDVELALSHLQRNFYTTSSCGVCGNASLEALSVQGLTVLDDDFRCGESTIRGLPETLRNSQPTFANTGGLHAAGLFSDDGTLVSLREDVGRHNAVDKLLGESFLGGTTQLADRLIVLSGRASFEIMQKALVARVPMIVAVGAPSSLAIELARRYNVTLIGFASDQRFNVYSGGERVLTS
jgi:FdhD protein